MERDVLLADLWIPGEPRPKGSMKPVGNRYGKGPVKLVEQVAGSTAWLNTMTNVLWQTIRVARGAEGPGWEPGEGFPIAYPVAVGALFVVEPYACEVERGDALPTNGRHGDLDKLCRGLGDALQKAHVLVDDKLITRWIDPRKRFVGQRDQDGWMPDGPGVLVRVERDTP